MKSSIFVSCLVIATVAFADKKGPESVALPASSVKVLQEKAKDARIARLEAEKLQREMELGKVQLEKLIEQANKTQGASDKEFVAVCEKAGIPASEVGNYEGSENEKGEFVLKRRAAR